MIGKAGFHHTTTLSNLANGMLLSAGNSRLLPREPRAAVLPPRGRPGALMPTGSNKRSAPAERSIRGGPAGTARRVLLQLKPARWLADSIRKQKLERAISNGWEDDESRQKRTNMLRTFEPSKLKVRPTQAEMKEVCNAVFECDLARMSVSASGRTFVFVMLFVLAWEVIDQYGDGRLTGASFVAAASYYAVLGVIFALVPVRGNTFGYISDSIMEQWEATDNLQQIWFSLEQRYCWVPRSELVQQYTEMDGVYELPKDDLLLD